jgi:hypothetical protein
VPDASIGPDASTPPPDASTSPRDSGADARDGAVADAAPCATVGIPQSNVLMELSPADPERVTSLRWKDSTGTITTNVVGEGGPLHCTDPQELFGQSYGAPEGTTPLPVVAGHIAAMTTCGATVTLVSGPSDCANQPQIPVTTKYEFFGGALADEFVVTRTWGFGANGAEPAYNAVGLRTYVPRVALTNLNTVLYPNQAGTAITTTPATSCGGDCITPTGTTWNGQWFADVNLTTGLAMIVRRDPSMTAPVSLTINYDSYSNANLTSFILVKPTDGWQTTISELEYVCFADLTTWPKADRDAAKLPPSCGPTST